MPVLLFGVFLNVASEEDDVALDALEVLSHLVWGRLQINVVVDDRFGEILLLAA